MNRFVTIAVKTTAGTGIHGTMDVAADVDVAISKEVITWQSLPATLCRQCSPISL